MSGRSDVMVDHPAHYISETGMEAIDVIESFTFNLSGIEAVDTAQVLKYIMRWKSKNGVQDLKKAEWYLKHLIEHMEKLEAENLKGPLMEYAINKSNKIILSDEEKKDLADYFYEMEKKERLLGGMTNEE